MDAERKTTAGPAGGAVPEVAAPGAVPTVAGTLGEIAWLLTQSAGHRWLFLADLEWLVMTPMLLGQFRTFRTAERVVGLALWAWVSDEVERRLEAGVARLSPGDWKSGERLWLVDLVAPFGGAEAMVAELRATVLRGQAFKFHATLPDGTREVREVPAEDAEGQA